jgi:serine/threonine protein kinase
MARPVGVGSILDGRFGITSLINRGALSTVFEAVDWSTGELVAIKVPLPGYDRDPLYLTRFSREEVIGSALHHPSVVRVLAMEKKSQPYLVMERLGGTPLSTFIKEGQPLPLPEALRIAVQIARALEYLHANEVVHRDLKPSNVILFEDGSIRVIDLGMAKAGDGREFEGMISFQASGTPDYMPPEQVRGQSGDRRSDIYSLGGMLYEMLTGYPPFRGDDLFYVLHARVVGDPVSPRRLNPNISAEVEETVLHALARHPDHRFSSATEFRRELEHPEGVVVTGRAGRLQPPGAWSILWRRIRDFVWAMVAIMGFFAMMIFIAGIWGRRR